MLYCKEGRVLTLESWPERPTPQRQERANVLLPYRTQKSIKTKSTCRSNPQQVSTHLYKQSGGKARLPAKSPSAQLEDLRWTCLIRIVSHHRTATSSPSTNDMASWQENDAFPAPCHSCVATPSNGLRWC